LIIKRDVVRIMRNGTAVSGREQEQEDEWWELEPEEEYGSPRRDPYWKNDSHYN
jgi:hypothetical protein